MKENYLFKEVKKLLVLEHDCNAFVRWYEDSNHTTLDSTLRYFVLINTIKDIERARKEMEKYLEFFDKGREIRLNKIINNLEILAQNRPSYIEE